MILIFGFKAYATVLGVLTFICPHCHNPAAQRVTEHTRRFTLFFIPLFTTSKRLTTTCAYCGTESAVSRDQIDRLRHEVRRSEAEYRA